MPKAGATKKHMINHPKVKLQHCSVPILISIKVQRLETKNKYNMGYLIYLGYVLQQ